MKNIIEKYIHWACQEQKFYFQLPILDIKLLWKLIFNRGSLEQRKICQETGVVY